MDKEKKIQTSYQQSKNIYDDLLTQNQWWGKLYIKLFWGGVDDNEIARKVLAYIPNDFHGRILDVPVGTAVFTYQKFLQMKHADIVGLDYSEAMLEQARQRLGSERGRHITLQQGDVGQLPYADASFEVVLSMNGFHAFPDKSKAFAEIHRVLKPQGQFIACFYIKGKSQITDWWVDRYLAKKGWFTPPFETDSSLHLRLEQDYVVEDFQVEGSMVYFCAVKK